MIDSIKFKIQTCSHTLLSWWEPLSLLGALISTDVFCFSVVTSNMSSSYLQFIACPLSVGLTLKISPPRFQFGHREARQHVKMINQNQKEMEYFLSLQLPIFFPLNQGGTEWGRVLSSRCNLKEKWKRQTTMVLLSQCDFRSGRGLELHFSEEQRPVEAGTGETFQTRQEQEHTHTHTHPRYCNFMGNYGFSCGH